VTIHLDRVHDPARARDPSLEQLLELLRNLTRDVEAVRAEGARGCGEVAAGDPCKAGH
jgi:hypothetical protein